MKYKIIGLLLTTAVFFSCSTDKDEVTNANAIVGTWQLTELELDQPASTEAILGKQILDLLADQDCYLLSFEFKSDMTLIAESSIDFIDFEALVLGNDLTCPTESDIESSTYEYDGSVLTTIDENGETLMIDVTISGNIMTVDASDFELESFTDSGELIFQKF